MIEICNMNNELPSETYDVIIDRSSSLGNIYTMFGESDRNNVCNKYQKWFDNTVLLHKQVSSYRELIKIESIYVFCGKLRLFCWCYPKRCHGETIKSHLEIKYNQLQF